MSLALFEIGGAWLVWQGIRAHKGWIWAGAGVISLGLYSVVATWQQDDNFGRILAACGGIFVAGSMPDLLITFDPPYMLVTDRLIEETAVF
ncbi:YnfA family protein [Streptomyces brasiliensis]|uniref:Uncharacterized protein n=1 Tax=Streptomyces brasiliensis TaxID=1954 RepID=A0A917L387_9ACTN|nr:YnfA family protein [Streptomyces brasiliensis]GGJ40749.1 hypothetical protein GCM10010121_059760 [Streptomyces brasiliensis]